MGGKPVIDILVAASEYPLPDTVVSAVEKGGYEYFGEVGAYRQLYFRKRNGSAINVLVVEENSALWAERLVFRDFLIAHPDAAKRYESVKRNLIASGINMLFAYAEGKHEVVSGLLEESRVWDKRKRT